MTLQNKEQNSSPKENLNIDVIEKCVGSLGRWHLWVCFMIFLVKFPAAWHQLNIIFLAPPVVFSCADNVTDKCSSNCTSYIYDTSLFSQTIITEWDLVCEKEYLVTLAQTLTMLGILIGSVIFGYLSDRFGRRCPFVVAVILQIASGLAAAFSPWFILFLVMKFLSALATGGVMIISFVFIMELVGTQWRTILGILYQIPFNLGYLTLPLISYFLRDWRYFQVAISTPSIILILYYWILPESPRWQLTVGQTEGAIETLRKAAKFNQLPTNNIEQEINNYCQKKGRKEANQNKGNIFDLVKTPIMRLYTISICVNWTICGLCFFGVTQFMGQLAGNIFINVAISAVVQVPGTLFACWATKAWGRKTTIIISNVVSGLSLFLVGFVPSNPTWIKTTLASIGMFGQTLSFTTIYIYSGELFPTTVRNVGIGTSSMCARVGSMVAPFVLALASVRVWIPPVILGILPFIGAVFCFKLPETLDCKLPDTIEEAENFEKRKTNACDIN